MDDSLHPTVQEAISTLKAGGLLVYPTEAVFGLGCDAFNEQALINLRDLKRRDEHKGFIVLCASFEQLITCFPELDIGDNYNYTKCLQQTQAHPTTWIIPSNITNTLLLGQNQSLAVRITEHPIAKQLCVSAGPIVSSSANVAGDEPIKELALVRKYFLDKVDYYLDGSLGNAQSPSQIINIENGQIIRSA